MSAIPETRLIVPAFSKPRTLWVMAKELPTEIKVGDIVRRRFINKDDKRYDEKGTVVALGKKYKGHVPQPAAKVQFKSTSRVLWYFLDKIQLVTDS